MQGKGGGGGGGGGVERKEGERKKGEGIGERSSLLLFTILSTPPPSLMPATQARCRAVIKRQGLGPPATFKGKQRKNRTTRNP